MQFRPSRVVTVTTQEELDSAFGSADRLIVEGDDALLSYAATKAAGESGNAVKIEMRGDLSALSATAPPRLGGVMPLLAAVLVLTIALAAVAIFYFEPFPRAAGPIHHQHHESANSSGQLPVDEPIAPGAAGQSEWAPFMWPTVSIVAILALFFTARQAIAGGRNVDISWKVTEKVSGRVVITKVRTPARQRAAAA